MDNRCYSESKEGDGALEERGGPKRDQQKILEYVSATESQHSAYD